MAKVAPPPEPEHDINLREALEERYLAYALSTITQRALPDVRDGLKPVHRRVLYAMRQLKLDPGSGFKKSARVVGDVIGRYHPHGDQSVYDALVRLAQDFSVRYPLVDGQGNFGNVDGDNAAAMRYTEARLTEVAALLLDGIDEDTVDFRETYDGKLTYAANWDEYSRCPFWDQLDFIGVDAYFPLSEKQYPTRDDLKKGWQPWKSKLEGLSREHRKPVLFTEFGYRSMDYAGKKPWLVHGNEMKVNLEAQADATQVIFEEFWNEDWFAGGFLWKWFIHHDRVGGQQDNRFTPQNKPAEAIIRNHYAQVKKLRP